MPSAELYATLDMFDTHWKAIGSLGDKHNKLVEYLTSLAKTVDDNFQILDARVAALEKEKEELKFEFEKLAGLFDMMQKLVHVLSENGAEDLLDLCKLECRIEALERATGLDQ